jgi:hypothetical protein
MRIIAFVLGCLVVGACGRESSPIRPTNDRSSTTASARSVDAAAPGEPNHFDPDPIRGFESTKWHDLNYKNPKYVFGRALVGLAPTDDNLERVAIAQGVLYLGKDLVAFSDGTVVDFIYDFNGPKARWQYQQSH